jgi:hypothetical protein
MIVDFHDGWRPSKSVHLPLLSNGLVRDPDSN